MLAKHIRQLFLYYPLYRLKEEINTQKRFVEQMDEEKTVKRTLNYYQKQTKHRKKKQEDPRKDVIEDGTCSVILRFEVKKKKVLSIRSLQILDQINNIYLYFYIQETNDVILKHLIWIIFAIISQYQILVILKYKIEKCIQYSHT